MRFCCPAIGRSQTTHRLPTCSPTFTDQWNTTRGWSDPRTLAVCVCVCFPATSDPLYMTGPFTDDAFCSISVLFYSVAPLSLPIHSSSQHLHISWHTHALKPLHLPVPRPAHLFSSPEIHLSSDSPRGITVGKNVTSETKLWRCEIYHLAIQYI